MLRDFQANYGKVKNTMFKAADAMVTGMAVVKNHVNNTVAFPAAATADNLFLVTKERVPTGINAGRGDMSDYDDNFVKITEDEFVGLEQYVTQGERFGTDQYVKDGLAVGDVVMAGTDGKFVKATAGMESTYVYVGEFDDVGHTLAIIEVLGTPVANA